MKSFIYKDFKFGSLLLLFTICANFSFSQKYKYFTAEKNMENWSHALNHNGKGTLLDVNYQQSKKKNYTLTTSDANFKNMTSKEISFLENKTFQFSYFRGSRLYLFATDKDQALFKFQVDPETFSMMGSPEALFSFGDDVTEYRTAYSRDSVYFSILCRHHGKKAQDDNFAGIIFDATFSAVNKYECVPPVPVDEIIDIDFTLSPQGTAAIVCQTRKNGKRKNDDSETGYAVTTVTGTGKPLSKVVASLFTGDIQNINWYFDAENLIFNGLTGDSRKKGFTRFVSGSYKVSSGVADEIKTLEFSTFNQKSKVASPSMNEVVEHGLPNDVVFKQSVDFPDHSSLLIYSSEGSYVPNHVDPMNPQKYTPKITSFYSGNTYVIKLDADKKIEWFHAIVKKQAEAAVDLYTGISYIVAGNNSIHIFYYDNNDNAEVFTDGKIRDTNLGNIKKSSLACVTIKPSGTISKAFVWDNTEQESYMMPGYSLHTKANEVMFVAVKKSKDGWFTFAKIAVAD